MTRFYHNWGARHEDSGDRLCAGRPAPDYRIEKAQADGDVPTMTGAAATIPCQPLQSQSPTTMRSMVGISGNSGRPAVQFGISSSHFVGEGYLPCWWRSQGLGRLVTDPVGSRAPVRTPQSTSLPMPSRGVLGSAPKPTQGDALRSMDTWGCPGVPSSVPETKGVTRRRQDAASG